MSFIEQCGECNFVILNCIIDIELFSYEISY